MKEKKKKFTRYSAISVIMCIVYLTIASRLIYLQIVKAEDFKERANNRAITEIPDPAPRGNILDTNGAVLAENHQSYMLVYNETDESKKYFFETMDKVFKLLDENSEQQQDDCELKINPFRFEFKTDDEDAKKILEIRFKRDRGLNEKVQEKLFGDKKDKLTKDEEKAIDKELLKITPEETFDFMIEQYKISPETDFRNLVSVYGSNPNEVYSDIVKRFNLNDSSELKSKLNSYAKKASKEMLSNLVKEYGIDKMEYDIELKRKYMVIKDTVKMNSFTGYKPVTISANIKKDTAFVFLQRLNDLPGIDVNNQPIRYYPYGEIGSAFLGYISKINSYQGEKYKEKGYDISSDYIGTAGIEAVYEDRLKGSKGGRIVKLNKQGRVIEELGRREPYPGQNVQLTIDKDVQVAAEKSLDKVMVDLRANPNQSYDNENTANATRGAAVAIDINTGGIIALASLPGFDPNDFSTPGKLTTEKYNEYFNPDLDEFAKKYIAARNLPVTVDELFPPIKKDGEEGEKVARQDKYDIYPKPFYNYATSALNAPGSTFKPLTAIAALEEGVLTKDETIYDNMVFTKNGYSGGSWDTSSAGAINVIRALAISNNYFFYELGYRLYQKGIDTLAKYAWEFGLGTDPNGNEKPYTGVEIPENFGQVFNSQSEKNRNSIFKMWSLYDELKQLKKVKDKNEYEGINIQIDDKDETDIKNLKEKIQNTITYQMKYNNNKNFTNEIKGLLKELINKDPSLKNKSFTDGDISKAVNLIWASINSVEEIANRPGNVFNAAIGQGSNYFTPLQMANYIATIVNGGSRYKLHLTDKILDSDNKTIKEIKPEIIQKVDVKPETLETVKEGMGAVVSEGTGKGAFEGFPIKTAGKTGSSTFNENIQHEIGRSSYGVYVGFAPYDNPKIAVCVLVFDGAHGGYVAPVARAMYEAYFKEELDKINYKPTFDFIK